MKTKFFVATVLLIAAFLITTVQPVSAVPPLPSGFYGTVKVGTNNVPVGTTITAFINGVPYASTTTTMFNGDSVYFVLVPGDDPDPILAPGIQGGVPNDTVSFRINNYFATQTGSWQSGPNVVLNLSLVPTAVTVTSFSATSLFNSAYIDWQTATESNLLGFNLYRSDTVDGVKTRLNSTVLQAQNSGQLDGAAYQYLSSVAQGHRYYFWLELIFTDSISQIAPIEFDSPFLQFLPTMN